MVDDVDVARALLDAVAQFGRERGMTEVVGPLGFTDFDPEGMLTDGFDQLGTMATIYNYPYYPKLMEQLGGWEKDNEGSSIGGEAVQSPRPHSYSPRDSQGGLWT